MGHVGSEEVSYCSSLEVTPTRSTCSTATPVLPRVVRPNKTSSPFPIRPSTTSTTLTSTDPLDDVAKVEGDLSRRREMIQMLDCEPILDYLMRNGAVSADQAEELLGFEDEEDALEKRNRRLLQIVETQQQSRNLFTNALRLTGQHFLANMADDGIRIKALSGSGYLSKSRHKGQVELYIRVNCVKSMNDVKFLAVSQILRKNTISLEDIQSTFSSVRRLEIQRNASLRLSAAIDENSTPKKIESKKSKGSKFACLFCGCFGKKEKKKAEVKLTNLINESYKNESTIQLPSMKSNPYDMDSTVNMGDFDDDDLREVSHNIHAFCREVYEHLASPQSQLHACLVRYFEQDRGVLLLEVVSTNNKLHLKFICTKLDQVESVKRDLESGKLARDIERFVCHWLKKSERNEESVTLDLRVVENSLEKSREELSQQ